MQPAYIPPKVQRENLPTATQSEPPSVDWLTFLSERFHWKQGEHVSLIGPTGGGKTTLAKAILPRRDWVVAFATKPRDPSLDALKKDGYRRLPAFSPRPLIDKRVILWPPIKRPEDMALQRQVFQHAVREIFTVGGWTIFADELRYLTENLKLRSYFQLIWLQGRSLGVSLVGATQRPAFVPTELYDQATHLFFWRDNDELNLRRIGGIGWLDAKTIRTTVASLPLHHVLYVNTRTGETVRTKVEV